MAVNSSANTIILIHFAFSDNLSAENSKLSADFYIKRIQLLECMIVPLIFLTLKSHIVTGVVVKPHFNVW